MIEFFFLTYGGVRFFPSVIRYDDIFSEGEFFSPRISLQDLFFSPKSVCRIYFFLSHPYPHVKIQMVALLSTSIVPSQIKGPKNYVQLQHLHLIEIQWKVYLWKFQILCWPQCGRWWFSFHRFCLHIIILGIHEKRLCITRARLRAVSSSLSSAGLERAKWPRGKLERGETGETLGETPFPPPPQLPLGFLFFTFARFARFPRSRDYPEGLLAVYTRASDSSIWTFSGTMDA